MRPCYHIEIVTPKKVVLNGLWFGPQKPKRAIVWVHGLGSSMFSKLSIVDELIDKNTAVIMFNNRGHEKVAKVLHVKGPSTKGGAAHENFTDCLDDIQGAIDFLRTLRIKQIYLAGHSTGCQKAVYFVSKKKQAVKGVILLAPLSDYSSERMFSGTKKMQKAEKLAREYIRRGKKSALLPEEVWGWPWIADAQRFMSLYTGQGVEEIFTYWDPARNPKTLRSVPNPTLVLLAQEDQYADTSSKDIAAWFTKHLKAKNKIVIVPKVRHGFQGAEKRVASVMKEFMKES